MDIILGMMRDVEIEDVAHIGNVEAARGDIAGHQQLRRSVAETFERGHAGALVHVAVQGGNVETVSLERFQHGLDVALAITEDDRVLEIRRVAQ